MALSSRLVIAGVESQRGFGVTFDQVASFLVQEIAPRLPNDLRKKFLGGKASVGRQIAKISARLRRASSRLKPQK
jgi:division protein CdvB (Snf7/Vps24/ESCRT-III family)